MIRIELEWEGINVEFYENDLPRPSSKLIIALIEFVTSKLVESIF